MKYEGYADINYNNERFLDCYYFGARYYDPEMGRFLTTDRFADKYPSLTPYQYTANNPMLFIDVNGDSINVTGQEQQAYIDMLMQLTGLTISRNKNGNLVIDGNAKVNKKGT